MPILFKPIILVCDTCGRWIHAAFAPDPSGKSGGVLMPVMCDAHPFHVKHGEIHHEQGCKAGEPVRASLDPPVLGVLAGPVLRTCEVAPPLADVTQGPLVGSPPVVTCLACRRATGGKLDQVTDEGDHG